MALQNFLSLVCLQIIYIYIFGFLKAYRMKGFAHSSRKHLRQILTMTLALKVGINRKIELEGGHH